MNNLLQNPYTRLMRLHQPIGIWLVLWPAWWALSFSGSPFSQPYLYLATLIGAIVMRSAGCVINDMWDKDIDKQVTRTKNRPIANGDLSRKQGAILLGILLTIGLLILLSLSNAAILWGFVFVLPVLLYPLAKRYLAMPQIILGLTINGGAIIAWAAALNGVHLPAFTLFFACFFWTLGYDTIYAYQDSKDDAVLGIGSSALVAGEKATLFLSLCYGIFFALMTLTFYLVNMSLLGYLLLGCSAIHLIWQVKYLNPRDPDSCHDVFKSNRDLGLFIVIAILLGH